MLGAAPAAAPAVYTRFAIDRETVDGGLFDTKIGVPERESGHLEGTHGSKIVIDIVLAAGDLCSLRKSQVAFSAPRYYPVVSSVRLTR